MCGDAFFFFFSSRRRHTRWPRDWSSDVCSSDLGPRRLNDVLWQAGFTSARIWHRLDEPHPLAENRVTRAVTLRQGDAVQEIAARDDSKLFDDSFSNAAFTELDIGTAHMREGARVDGPMSFAQKNASAVL